MQWVLYADNTVTNYFRIFTVNFLAVVTPGVPVFFIFFIFFLQPEVKLQISVFLREIPVSRNAMQEFPFLQPEVKDSCYLTAFLLFNNSIEEEKN